MFIREGKLDLGTIPQPLYAYAAGMTLLHEGEEAFNSGVCNTFVELCWGAAESERSSITDRHLRFGRTTCSSGFPERII